eukprot:m.160208 g.160208  ORF g.160208 m.160208 type:complete len:56 (+) comp31174_c0_seq1:660-827(+)
MYRVEYLFLCWRAPFYTSTFLTLTKNIKKLSYKAHGKLQNPTTYHNVSLHRVSMR